MAAAERVGDMTREELLAFVEQVLQQHLRQGWYIPKSDRTPAEIWESMSQNIIQPKAGTPSTLELLREDRDR